MSVHHCLGGFGQVVPVTGLPPKAAVFGTCQANTSWNCDRNQLTIGVAAGKVDEQRWEC